MKVYVNRKTTLTLTEKAFEVYSNTDPLTITAQDDGRFSIHGIEERADMTEADLNAWLEELGDEEPTF